MFIKHIIDEDVFRNGFVLNPVFNESFSREKIDTTYISTYMQIWVDINSYRYKVLTDREGVIDRGSIFSASILKSLTEKYFDNDIRNYIERRIKHKLSSLNSNFEKRYLSMIIRELEDMNETRLKRTMLTLFGESYA